jgi:hypothetical protein
MRIALAQQGMAYSSPWGNDDPLAALIARGLQKANEPVPIKYAHASLIAYATDLVHSPCLCAGCGGEEFSTY